MSYGRDVSAEHIAYLQRRAKFKMFFAGLTFAVLSFIGAHPIVTNRLILKFSETAGLFLMLIAGIILLAQLDENIRRKSHRSYWIWIFFIPGILFLILNRSILLFIN